MSAEVVDFAGLDAQAVDAGASTEVESIDSGTNEVETQESESGEKVLRDKILAKTKSQAQLCLRRSQQLLRP
jgi:hypothetical protein